MQSKYYFHELPHKEKSKFFAQEGFYEFISIRKCIFVLFITVVGSDIILRLVVYPVVQPQESNSAFKSTTFFLLGAMVVYFSTLLSIFQRKGIWLSRFRYVLYWIAALFYAAYIFFSVFYYFNQALKEETLEDWTLAAITLLSCIHSAAIVFLIAPIWYFKVLIIGSCHVAFIISYWKASSPMKGWVLVKGLANLCYMTAYILLGYYFRWKLFLKNSETEGRNQVYNDILDSMLSLIAIVDSCGEVIYSNRAFKNMTEGNSKSLFMDIINLKLRDPFNHLSTLETHHAVNGVDQSFTEHRCEIPGIGAVRYPLCRTMESHNILPPQFQNLDKLIKFLVGLLNKGELHTEDQIVFDAKMNQVYASKNTMLSYEVIIRPLFEQKKLIVTLNNTTQRDLIASLEDNNEYKDKLLASVSHELRTPLNGNIGFLQAALHEDLVPQGVKDKLLLPALRSGKLLYHLINDILDYSKMQTEKIKLSFELRPLKGTLEYCYQLFEHVFRKKNLEFELMIDKDIRCQMRTDHDRLIQVTLNLLSNALKFTRNGKVCLEARHCDDLGTTEIIVSDTGIGISQKDIPRLFEEQAVAKDLGDSLYLSKGVGLGLKIADKLARILSSDKEKGLKVVSEIGAGTIFSFQVRHIEVESKVVPLSLQGIQEEKETPQPSSRSLASLPEVPLEHFVDDAINMKFPKSCKKQPRSRSPLRSARIQATKNSNNDQKILLVDDDMINILALQHLLEQLEVKTDVAYNGQEALDKITDQPEAYKLVFMDCQMPIMDGFEASRQITERIRNGNLPEVPIIGCTAFSSLDKIEECINSGMNEVLLKPVMKDKLKELLDKYLKAV